MYSDESISFHLLYEQHLVQYNTHPTFKCQSRIEIVQICNNSALKMDFSGKVLIVNQ